jgi:vesicle coat complex subunit
MSTQRIRHDLSSNNKFIVALALASLSEVATEDMCRDLASEVAQVISNTSSLYIKKKAVLAAVKCIR